ncbi:MAG: S-adenosyl-L-methionine-dependent methyltransferase [Linnemannia gamsii]|nr:MAG: S-adenosyl-L-methionine-dependent methyltransferase [Linnemannia gamsii]
MRPTTELVRIWAEALVPVCNNSKSHASQELKWLLQHAKQQSLLVSRQARSSPATATTTTTTTARVTAGGLSEREVELMQGYVDERVKARKPLQYILGTQPFMDLEILTRPPTLIPRWETEEWTARLATALKNNPLIFRQHQQATSPASSSSSSSSRSIPLFNILDICTGSGCIPLGLASALPPKSSRLFGADIHPKAVQLAQDNEAHNRTLLNGNLVQFHQTDLLAPNSVEQFLSWLENDGGSGGSNSFSKSGAGRYNLIISNPPYIAHSEYEELEPEVAQWEDPKALLADQEGLVFYPRIAHMAMELLHQLDRVKIPELVFEIGGDHQVDSVTAAVRQAGFRRVEVWKDLADRARCIVGAR